jgi:rod shape-determining protein MreD
MSRRRTIPAVVEPAILLCLGFVAVQAALIPLGPGGRLAAPDLLYCLLIAWVIRRPAQSPLWVVLLLGLFADVMLSRPIGLGALGVLLLTEAFRTRAALFHNAPFAVEWLAATLGFAAMLAAMNLALKLVLAAPPGLTASLHHLLATTLSYPLVVLGLTWCLGLRAPSVARGEVRLGRHR